ncbi:hypothetical protein BZA05DRAFT_387311 [Tricharina praecox]|uniref:uncharacterized protein n=1 Tax=Tricharina praecox TaxID=43433 RepID=UPI00221E3BBB|nr:uncharacterized protein BZA05DRAFT_387311 [Tricharina praecox]KAI5857119.1 hypothetical protein BZA05DRAFT_387311 [Tricharina praecox]
MTICMKTRTRERRLPTVPPTALKFILLSAAGGVVECAVYDTSGQKQRSRPQYRPLSSCNTHEISVVHSFGAGRKIIYIVAPGFKAYPVGCSHLATLVRISPSNGVEYLKIHQEQQIWRLFAAVCSLCTVDRCT